MRNRYRRFNICLAFVLMSALSLLAQSDRVGTQPSTVQRQGNPGQPLLTARLDESPAMASVRNESELPDTPSATKPDASTADPAPSPAVRRESSHGAPPAASGGPLWADRSVMDRNYLLLTGGMFGASILNAELTLRCLNTHTSCNDVPSSLKSRAAMYGIGIPADLGIAYLTYHLKRKHNHMWFVPEAVVTGANAFLAVRAYRWTQDPGLPVGAARRSIR
ncbi:MAG TPA: hypothetical protein VNZ03_20230 [Terriglobales bacterium]|nr:hypothetical protein [Terriglobales bacterium]